PAPPHTPIYTLSLHDALPISAASSPRTRRSSSPGSRHDGGLHEAPPAGHARDGALLGGRAPPPAGRAALPRLRHPSLPGARPLQDRKSTRLNSSHVAISYAVF